MTAASWLERLAADPSFDARLCQNCGTCTALCPLGLELLPRRLFRYVLMGQEEKVRAELDTVYSCLLCRLCEANCTAGVHIAENLRTLRHHVNREVLGLAEA